jgi:hypothetical protein
MNLCLYCHRVIYEIRSQSFFSRFLPIDFPIAPTDSAPVTTEYQLAKTDFPVAQFELP